MACNGNCAVGRRRLRAMRSFRQCRHWRMVGQRKMRHRPSHRLLECRQLPRPRRSLSHRPPPCPSRPSPHRLRCRQRPRLARPQLRAWRLLCRRRLRPSRMPALQLALAWPHRCSRPQRPPRRLKTIRWLGSTMHRYRPSRRAQRHQQSLRPVPLRRWKPNRRAKTLPGLMTRRCRRHPPRHRAQPPT